MILYTCPNCGYRRAVGDDLAGRRVKCPKCSEVVRLPWRQTPPVASPTLPEPEPAAATPSPRSASRAVRWLGSAGPRRLLAISLTVLCVAALAGLAGWHYRSARRITSLLVGRWEEREGDYDRSYFEFGLDGTFHRVLLLKPLNLPAELIDVEAGVVRAIYQQGEYHIDSFDTVKLVFAGDVICCRMGPGWQLVEDRGMTATPLDEPYSTRTFAVVRLTPDKLHIKWEGRHDMVFTPSRMGIRYPRVGSVTPPSSEEDVKQTAKRREALRPRSTGKSGGTPARPDLPAHPQMPVDADALMKRVLAKGDLLTFRGVGMPMEGKGPSVETLVADHFSARSGHGSDRSLRDLVQILRRENRLPDAIQLQLGGSAVTLDVVTSLFGKPTETTEGELDTCPDNISLTAATGALIFEFPIASYRGGKCDVIAIRKARGALLPLPEKPMAVRWFRYGYLDVGTRREAGPGGTLVGLRIRCQLFLETTH